MKCKNCGKKPVWKFTNKTQLCKQHFIRYFERKILKQIRKSGGLSQNYEIIGNSKRDLRIKIIKQLIEKMKKRVYRREKRKFNVYNLNDFSIDIIYNQMYKNNSFEKIKLNKKQIYPLLMLSDEETNLYAKLTKIKGQINHRYNKEQKEINKLLEKFKKTNPDIRRSVVNGFLAVDNLII